MSPRGNRDLPELPADAPADEQPQTDQPQTDAPADAPADEQASAADQAAADAAPKLCGKPVTKRDKEGNAQKYTAENVTEGHNVGDEITAPCIKAFGHDKDAKSKHSWRAYTKIDTSVITLDDVNSFDAVPTDEVVESVREAEDSDVQKAINAQVEAAFRRWEQAGKPKNWGEAIKKGVVAKYRVTPENEAAWRSMLRIAASRTADRSDFPHVSVKAHPKLKRMTDGTTQLWFYVVEHKARESAETGATPANTPEPAATGA